MIGKFDAFIGVVGMPRSGTTLIHRAISAHSRVVGVIEPYQTRRANGYEEVNISQFCDDFELRVEKNQAVVVKETTTRRSNVTSLFSLMNSASELGIYTGLVIILRCPFEAYLSQIEASKKYWKEKKMTEHSEEAFRGFAAATRNGMMEIVNNARAQHFRIVSYEKFCQEPRNELARLMALVPLSLEQEQLNLTTQDNQRGGDPKTYLKGKHILKTNRDREVEALIKNIRNESALNFFLELRNLCVNEACVEPDTLVLDRLTNIVLKAKVT